MPQSKCTFYVTQIMYTLIVLGNCFSFFFVFIFIGSVCLFWSRILFYKLYIKHKVLGVKRYDRKLYSFAAEILWKRFLCVCQLIWLIMMATGFLCLLIYNCGQWKYVFCSLLQCLLYDPGKQNWHCFNLNKT